MRYFLVERNDETNDYSVRTFAKSAPALKAYGKREDELFPWDGSIRVCLFRAESLDALKETHGSWFYTLPELIGKLGEAIQSMPNQPDGRAS